MSLRLSRVQASVAGWLVVAVLLPGILLAQAPTGAISGQVTDPSGAGIPGAKVTAVSSGGKTKAGVVHPDGSYEIHALPPGTYAIKATAQGFVPFEQSVHVTAGEAGKLNIPLKISQEVQQVQVTGETTRVSVNPSENATALVIRGEDLKALSDDPDELQSELQALAGPSAGPNGGQIYVDGFTAGQLPPKADIMEIRINQNPFSAEYDKLGYGRIEITTRPGTSQFHGQVMGDLNLSAFNSRNPFSPAEQPAYHTDYANANVGGPLSKKASFFVNFFRRDIGDNSVVSAFVLSPTLTQIPFSQAVPSPRTLTNLSPRVDLQLSTNNVLSVRYQFYDYNITNSGVGVLDLASQGLNSHILEHTIQLSDTQVFSAKTLNQFRFQYLHDVNTSTPQSTEPTLSVLGGFTGGGNPAGTTNDVQDHYELQNLVSLFHGKHTLVFGGRLRDVQDSNTTSADFNGTFTFPSLDAYQSAEQSLLACTSAGGVNCQAAGASQFLIAAGTPHLNINMFDAGLFAQDDWKVRPNITLSLGLRWESQSGIPNHSNWAPRVGLAWGIGRHHAAPKTVLRAGFGIFYDRFPETLILQSERYNGISQMQFLIPSPTFFPTIPSASSLAGASETATRYQIDPHFTAPSMMESAVSIEQQVTRSATVSLTYLNSHGIHQMLTNNINAPLPGTFPLGDPSVGIRPYGDAAGNIYNYESGGLFNQNQLIANFNVRLRSTLTLGGFYSLSYADSDSNGTNGAFVMNPYDIRQDYGRAPFDVRNRALLIGNWNLPHRFSLSPFVVIASGTPLNVTSSQDLFGTGVFNARPALTSPSSCAPLGPVYCTSLGTFNSVPATVQSIIPPYEFDNPGQFTFNLRLSKTIGFGRETRTSTTPTFGRGGGGGGGGRGGGGLGGRGLSGGGGPGGMFGGSTTTNRRFNLTFSVSARNLFNNVNLGPRVGILGSSLFGQSNSIGGLFGSGGLGGATASSGGGAAGPALTQAANRRIDIQVLFSF